MDAARRKGSPRPRDGRKREAGGSAGVSLIELIVALATTALVVAMALALYKDVGRLARKLTGGIDEAFQARLLFHSLSENLLAGGGLLGLGPGNLRLLNPAGKRVEYRWEDSVLTVNGKPQAFRLASLEIKPFGPLLPAEEDWNRERMAFAELDSLDDDRDGQIDFDELDRDRSGELEFPECRHVARVEIVLVTVHEGKASTLAGAIHPRNHAREGDADSLEAFPGFGDFGR